MELCYIIFVEKQFTVLMIVSSFLNMEFRNVVFNAARDGKLRRLKVGAHLVNVVDLVDVVNVFDHFVT